MNDREKEFVAHLNNICWKYQLTDLEKEYILDIVTDYSQQAKELLNERSVKPTPENIESVFEEIEAPSLDTLASVISSNRY